MREMLHFMIDAVDDKRLRVIYRFASSYLHDFFTEAVRREYREQRK